MTAPVASRRFDQKPEVDDKGKREGNLALGKRRVKAAAGFLIKEGGLDTRLWTVSNGSDRPVCAEKTEACAAKNPCTSA